MANIKVAVRVRPMSQKETSTGGRHVVHVQDNSVSITNIKVPVEGSADHRERIRHFAFDYAYELGKGDEDQGGNAKPRGDAKSKDSRRPSRKDSRRTTATSRKTSRSHDRAKDIGTEGKSEEPKEVKNEEQREGKSEEQTEIKSEHQSEEQIQEKTEHQEDNKSEDQRSVKSEDLRAFDVENQSSSRKEQRKRKSRDSESENHLGVLVENQSEDLCETKSEVSRAVSEAQPEDLSHEGQSEGKDYTGNANWDQERVYRELGREVEAATVYGYNACVLAYGQSGSGKTYTILGHKEAPGLAPRMCQGLLTRLQERYSPDDLCAQDFTLSLSLVEIYNERVRDLLTDCDPGKTLRVREHPHTGPYVDGVTRHPVTDTGVAWSLLERGRASRSVASTASHAHSSRSHALLTLDVTQPAAHTRSTLTLVDLAGSERANEEVDKARLTEGASINRSLVTLGNVISALAERGAAIGSTIAGSLLGSNLSLNSTSSRPTYAHSHSTTAMTEGMPAHSQRRSSRLPFIPYRDSVLTWLLKDTLGGNAKTLMIATVSPSSTSFAESVSTLRYATRARCIVNMPVVNLDTGTATIRSLKREVAALRRLLCDAKPSIMKPLGTSKTTLLDIISHASTSDLTRDWIEHLHKEQSKDHKRVRRKSAPVGRSSSIKHGLNRSTSSISSTEAVQSSCGPRDIIVETELPYLLNTLDDTHSSSIIIYHIQNGASVVGCGDNADIYVVGSGVSSSHCSLIHARGAVTLRCLTGCEVEVSSERVLEGGARRLRDGDTLTIGSRSFTFHAPTRIRPRSNSCPRREIGARSPGPRRECVFPRLHRHQSSASRKPSCTSEAGVQMKVIGQGQAYLEDTEYTGHQDSFYSSCRSESDCEEVDDKDRPMDAGTDKRDESYPRHSQSAWGHPRKSPKDFLYEEVQDAQFRFPSTEQSDPVGVSQSENVACVPGTYLTDNDNDQESTNHCLFHDACFFSSNTSLDSSISQPSCASLDSRLAHISGSSNTYHSRVLSRTFFLDLAKDGHDANSSTNTPLVSPQSPSESRRRWDKSVWPEVERGLRRNQSVPHIDCVRTGDDRQHKKHGNSFSSQHLSSGDREKRQKIIDAVTRRLYPGSGPGFGRRPRKVLDKPNVAGERECRCRKKAVSDTETPTTKSTGKIVVSAPGTPRHLNRLPSVVPGTTSTSVLQRSPGSTPILWRRCSAESDTGSHVPLPVRGDQSHNDRSPRSPKQESGIPVLTRTTKQVTRREVKTTTTTKTRTLNTTETKTISAVPRTDDKPRMFNQAVGCDLSDVRSYGNVGPGETVGIQVGMSSFSNNSDSENISDTASKIEKQPIHPEVDLLSDVIDAPSGGQERERRRIPLTPALHQLRRALASLNDPERFSDDSLELCKLETDTQSPLILRLSPTLADDDDNSLGDISKDSLEESMNSLESQDVAVPFEIDNLASSRQEESKSSDVSVSIVTEQPTPGQDSALPRTVRRWTRERVEKRIIDSTSSEDSDLDSRRRPRFRKRRPRRSSLPITSSQSQFVYEHQDNSDSTDYLSVQHSSPEKIRHEVLGMKDMNANKTSKAYSAVYSSEVDTSGEYKNLQDVYSCENFSIKTASTYSNAGILSEKNENLSNPLLPSNRDMHDGSTSEYFSSRTRIQQEAITASQHRLDMRVASSRDIDSQEMLKESARRLLQTVSKDGPLSEASQFAVADLLKASSHRLASYALGISDGNTELSEFNFPRSDSGATLDEDYDTAQGEESWQESSNDSHTSLRKKTYSASRADSECSTTSKKASPQKVKMYQVPAKKKSSFEEFTSSVDLVGSSSGGEMSPNEFMGDVTDDSTSATTPIASPVSEFGSTESSWEEFEAADHEQKGELNISKKQLQVIAAEFTPRTARRLLYTIIECSESSRSEGAPSEPDVIPSDWQDTLSDAEEEFGSGSVSCEVSEEPLSSSDDTMLDTVRPNQDDPQDSLSCVSDDVLADFKPGLSEGCTVAVAQQLAQNLAGSLEFLTSLPLSPECPDREDDSWDMDTTLKSPCRESPQLLDERGSLNTSVLIDDLACTNMHPGLFVKRSSLPECVPSLDLSHLGNSPTSSKLSLTSDSKVSPPLTPQNSSRVSNMQCLHTSQPGQVPNEDCKHIVTNVSLPVVPAASRREASKLPLFTAEATVVETRTDVEQTCKLDKNDYRKVTPVQLSCDQSQDIPTIAKAFKKQEEKATMENTVMKVGPSEIENVQSLNDIQEIGVNKEDYVQQSEILRTPRTRNSSADIGIYEALATETSCKPEVMPETIQNSMAQVTLPDGKFYNESAYSLGEVKVLQAVSLPHTKDIQTKIGSSQSVVEDNSSELIMEDNSSESTVEDNSSESTVEDNSSELIVEDNSFESTVEDNSFESTVEDNSSELIVEDNSSELIVEDNSSELIAEDNSSELIAEDNSSELIAEDNSSELIVEDNSSELIVEDNSSELIVEDNSFESTVEDNSFESTVEDNSSELIVEDNSSELIVEDNSSELIVEDNSSELIVEDNSSELIVEDNSSELIVEDNSSELIVEDNSSELIVEDNSSESTVEDNSSESTVEDNSSELIVEDNSSHVARNQPQQMPMVQYQAPCTVLPQDNMVGFSISRGMVASTLQNSMLEDGILQNTTREVISSSAITNLTSQNSTADAGAYSVMTPLTSDNSLFQVSFPQTIATELSQLPRVNENKTLIATFQPEQLSMVIDSTPRAPANLSTQSCAEEIIHSYCTQQLSVTEADMNVSIISLKPGNSRVKDNITQREILPQSQYSEVEVNTAETVMPLSLPNSKLKVKNLQIRQAINPQMPENAMHEVCTTQEEVHLPPLSSVIEVSSAHVMTTLTPQRSKIDVNTPHVVIPQILDNLADVGRPQVVSSLLPQDTVEEVSSSEEVIPQVPLSSLEKVKPPLRKQEAIIDVTFITPQNSVVQVSGTQTLPPATLESMTEDSISNEKVSFAPQNTMMEASSNYTVISQKRQHSVVEVIAPRVMSPLPPLNIMTELGNIHTVTPLIPQNSMVEITTSQAVTPLTPHNSMVEVLTSQAVTPLTPQNSIVEVLTSQAVTPLRPQNSVVEIGTQEVNSVSLEESTINIGSLQELSFELEQDSMFDASAPHQVSSMMGIKNYQEEVTLLPQNYSVLNVNSHEVTTDTPLTPQIPKVEVIVSQTVTTLSPQSSNIQTSNIVDQSHVDVTITKAVTPLTPQISMVEDSTSEAVTLIPQNSMVEVSTNEAVTPLTPQNSMVEVSTSEAVTPLTPQNSMVEVSTNEAVTPLTPQNSMVEVSTNEAVTPLTPQNSMVEVSTSQAVTPLTPQNSMVEVSTNEAVTPLTPQNSMVEVSTNEAVTPLTPQNSMVEVSTSQAVTPLTPQNSMVEVSTNEAVTPLTPQNSMVEVSTNEAVTPLTPQNSMVEVSTSQAVTPLTPQNSMVEVSTNEAVTPLTPQNSMVEVSTNEAVTPLTPQNSMVEVSTSQAVTPLTPQNSMVEVSTSQAVTPLTLQNSMVEVSTSQAVTPLTPQNSMVEVSTSQAVTPLTPQNSMVEVSTSQAVTPLTPQNSMVEVSTSQAVTPLTPQNSMVEV
ncbi:uncharacterized protein LOC121872609 isoform X2 [Homarus americanus]|uniref:uncharacterized protein LOC121872609 isoform X2 n=1 Tax=Homarus americanus TaxID=6706 RepID=UPI001C496D2B|nr:uncharacterized protein LOC121872609 isoform X2 [Homarus americanus]